jgi:FkbM family methyltransferase
LSKLVDFVRRVARKSGYDVVRYPPYIREPISDIKLFLSATETPMIFDVGANVGQSAIQFRHSVPTSVIHSFEPSPTTFETLRKQCADIQGVHTWNCGVGAATGQMTLIENVEPDMTSFLEPSKFAWGRVDKSTTVEVITLDDFTSRNHIDYIHILKSDTQGYEYEVLKGAKRLMSEERIAMVYLEFIFSDMYKGATPFDRISELLREQGFLLVCFYNPHFQEHLLSWNDALFIHSSFYRAFMKGRG